MDFSKFIGWLTFLVGVSTILFTLYSSYNIFTGKTAVPEIFSIETKETQSTQGKIPTNQEDVGQIISEQLKNLLPIDTFSKLLNLTIWTMGAGIFIFGGSQIASLGIKLIKTNKA